MKSTLIMERVVRGLLSLAALIACSAPLLILVFLVYFSLPLLDPEILREFLSGDWNPDQGRLGIYPMIVGTVTLAGLAMFWAAPLGIGLAVFLEVYAPGPLKGIMHKTVEFMAGIPTVVYAFAALFLLVPLIRGFYGYGTGLCLLSASLVLALLILPTITLVARDRLAAVPRNQVLAALSLGAGPKDIFFRVLLPEAWPGLISALVLGAGRAMGDTLIALMLAGNALALPESLSDSARTLTSHIALVFAADFESLSFKAIFLCGLILFILSVCVVLIMRALAGVKK